MKMVTFKKVICGVSLGTVMALGSMSSAFAADINHPTDLAKKVESQQQVKLLSQKQAEAIALAQYKGNVKDIQLTMENGKDVYIIVIHGQDGNDHTVKFDAITGAIVNSDNAQTGNINNGQNGHTNDVQKGNTNNYNAQRGKTNTNNDQNGNSNNTQKGSTNTNNDQRGKTNTNNDQNGNTNDVQKGKTNNYNAQNGNSNNTQKGSTNTNNDQNGNTNNDQNGKTNNAKQS